jgi:hypothetical protein
MMWRMRWLALMSLTACTHTPLWSQPTALANHAPELATSGHARIEVEQGGTALVDAEDVIAITIPGNQHSHLWGLVTTGHPDETRELTIRNLVAGCPGPDCLADRARGPVLVGTRTAVDPARVGMGIFGAAATGAAFTCLAECHDPGGWAYVGAVLALTTLIVPLASTF